MKYNKNLIQAASMMFLSLIVVNTLQAQDKKVADTTTKYLDRLVLSKDSSDKNLLRLKLGSLSKAKTEKEVLTAANYYYKLGNSKLSEQLYKDVETRFPNGKQARSAAGRSIQEFKTASEKEVAYKAWIKKFPPAGYENINVDDRLPYDYVRASIAGTFAAEKNIAKANEYANMLEVDFWKGNAYSGIATAFYKNGDLPNAEVYAKKAMDNAFSYIDGKKGNETGLNSLHQDTLG